MVDRFILALFLVALTSPMAIAREESSIAVTPLAPGLHLGYGTFSPLPEESLPALDALIATAASAGMDVARVMVDWGEVESGGRQYDLSLLEDQLARTADGSRLMLTLAVTDVDRYVVPDDLQVSETELASPLDEAGVIGRYLALLDHILPSLISEHGLFALSVANEPDILLSDRPAEETTAMANFTRAISDHASAAYPGLAVSLTVSAIGVSNQSDLMASLIEATDVSVFNWSCLDFATFESTGAATVPTDIDRLLALADGRDIIIQELSCGSGYADEPSLIGSSVETQAAWFEAFFAAMAATAQFRAAFVLDLVDWPIHLATEYTDFLRAEGLVEIADRYQEFLATWGLLTFDLQPKPAWNVLIDALTKS